MGYTHRIVHIGAGTAPSELRFESEAAAIKWIEDYPANEEYKARNYRIRPEDSLTLAGLETCDQDREAALAISQREEMETRLRSTRGDISARSGKMERHSPLFFGTGDNPLLW